LAQKDFDISVLDNMKQTFYRKVLFILSTTTFCCGVSLNVRCFSMPLSRHSCRKGLLVYSPLLFEQSTWSFFPYSSPCSSFATQTTPRLLLCASWRKRKRNYCNSWRKRNQKLWIRIKNEF